MFSTGPSEPDSDEGELAAANSGSGALVPISSRAQRSCPAIRPCRPSPVFVTHLIATAEQVPQTRSVRRASAADAQMAYQARRAQPQAAGLRTRQVI